MVTNQDIAIFKKKQPPFLNLKMVAKGGLEKNSNIGFQIHKTLSFPKMYSFHFLQKILTKKHKEMD